MKRLLVALVALVLLPLTSFSVLAEAPKEHVVTVVTDMTNLRMYFRPKLLQINPGDTVTWVNEAKEDHNIVTYPDGYPNGAEPFVSPYLTKKGDSWSQTFTVEGTYEYHCLPHVFMGMHGMVIVGRPSTADEYHEPSGEEVARYRDMMLEIFDEDEYEYMPRYVREKMMKSQS